MSSLAPTAVLRTEALSKRFCRDPHRASGYAIEDIADRLLMKNHSNRLRDKEFWALKNVSLSVAPGEVVGVIGHNGAGKSTLINLLAGIFAPTSGRVQINTNRSVLITHDGGLDLIQTGLENIYNQLSMRGLSRTKVSALVDSIIDFAGIGSAVFSPVGTYSLGMKIRLSFAIYSALEPELIIIDEALNGGDLKFRRKFQNYLENYIVNGGAMLLCSHDLFTVQSLSHRCILLEEGEIVAEGEPVDVIHQYSKNSVNGVQASESSVSIRVVPNLVRMVDDTAAQLSDESVMIESAALTSATGSIAQPGKPALLKIRCQSSEAIREVICGVELGVNQLFPIATFGFGFSEHLSLKAGANTLTCYIESLPLNPGMYDLAISIVAKGSGSVLGSCGYSDAPFQFEIENPTPNALTNMALFRKSIVHMPAVWSQQ